MYKRWSWIQLEIESYRISFSAFSSGALCSLPPDCEDFSLPTQRCVSGCQMVTVPGDWRPYSACQGGLFCFLISSAALAARTARVSQLQG